MSLADRKCQPCKGGVPALSRPEMDAFLSQLENWEVVSNDKHLLKSVKTREFRDALELANRIAVVAEEQNHHPDLLVRWGELRIELWTHKIDGLTEADFVLAAKIDRLLAGQ